jgi:hypothetical protein
VIAGRALGALSAGAGAVLLAWPHRVGTAVTPVAETVPAPWVVRLLGARMLAQGAIELARPARGILLLGGATDALHAASMVGLAAFDSRYRRPALTSAAVAGSNAAAAALLALTGERA